MARVGPDARRPLPAGDLRFQSTGRRLRDSCDGIDGGAKASVSQESAMKKNKAYWEMTAAELRLATRQFDDPAYQLMALPQTPEDQAQQRRARNKGGRPRQGMGA